MRSFIFNVILTPKPYWRQVNNKRKKKKINNKSHTTSASAFDALAFIYKLYYDYKPQQPNANLQTDNKIYLQHSTYSIKPWIQNTIILIHKTTTRKNEYREIIARPKTGILFVISVLSIQFVVQRSMTLYSRAVNRKCSIYGPLWARYGPATGPLRARTDAVHTCILALLLMGYNG